MLNGWVHFYSVGSFWFVIRSSSELRPISSGVDRIFEIHYYCLLTWPCKAQNDNISAICCLNSTPVLTSWPNSIPTSNKSTCAFYYAQHIHIGKPVSAALSPLPSAINLDVPHTPRRVCMKMPRHIVSSLMGFLMNSAVLSMPTLPNRRRADSC